MGDERSEPANQNARGLPGPGRDGEPPTELSAFAELARRVCAFIETAGQLDLRARLLAARAHLATLVAAATALPAASPALADSDDDDAPALAPPDLGRWDWYRELFDPYDDDSSPVMGSLADDLGDIHRELRDGLVAYDAGHASEATWRWWFGFEHHWGRHAFSALRAIHAALHHASDG